MFNKFLKRTKIIIKNISSYLKLIKDELFYKNFSKILGLKFNFFINNIKN